ncbi:hypothetical protein [Mesorhizobium sp. M0159]|uniref:hypothetical protein n=1 Tax=Mesorhizobium sp. M0159 TaxID=2956900 RepID=UPI00333701EB
MIEWGVHWDKASIFLMRTVIPFRFIEQRFGRIVNSIEGAGIDSGHETTTAQTSKKHAGPSRPNLKENEMPILSFSLAAL